MSKQKIAIVTGVTGQMGSYFVEFLLGKGFKVIGTVRRLSVKNHENISHIESPDFILAPMDLGDAHSINALVSLYTPDYFINCAANSFVGSSWDFPEQHFDFNALGVLRQLEAIKRFSPTTRYINFGSSEEFGDVQYSPQDEKHPARARSPYGASKIAARQIVKVYRESFGLYAIQCWCHNYESPRRGEEFVTRKITKGVARIAKAIKEGKPFSFIELGNLDSRRDWSFAGDFVQGVWAMLNQVAYPTGIPEGISEWDHTNTWLRAGWRPIEYLLSSGETHTVREFCEKAFSVAGIQGRWDNPLGKPEMEKYAWIPDGAYANLTFLVKVNPAFYRPADVELLMGDSTLARAELGWSPKVLFDELVERMVKHDLAEVGL
jgi:GDPmannose 4,6-dehydratase